MSTLQRRRMMMAQGVTYDGIPLTITNVSGNNVVISIIISGGLAPLLYYKIGDRKTYSRWDYNNITLQPQESMDIFGDNPEGFSKSNKEYINLRSSGDISVSGRVSSLSSTIRDYNYAFLFTSANVLSISEDLFAGVNLTPYCFYSIFNNNKNLQEVPPYLLPFTTLSTYCYVRMFSNTGLKKVPANFLPATNALNAYVEMFSGSDVSDIEVGAVNATSATYLDRMFMYCPLENIKEGAFKIITSYGNGAFTRMFSNCKFYSAPTKLILMGRTNYVYGNLFENNKNLQYVGDDFFNNLNVPKYQNTIFNSAFYGCTSLQSVSIPYGDDKVLDRPKLFINTFKGCTSLNRLEVKFTSWTYIDRYGAEQQLTPNWLTNVSPTGTFICPKELAEATDGYYDEEGNFVAGVGRSESTVPEGWTIDFPVIDARDGDANAMALMAVISQLIHADGTPWVKDSLVMMKSEAEKVTGIGGAFKGNTEITNLNVLKYFINATGGISFSGCTSLSSVTIPENITTLPSELLRETLVKNLFIPKSVINLSKSSNAFSGANYLEWVDVDEKNTKYNSYNGILYESSTFTCFYCPQNLTGSISIKPGTKIINNYFLNNRTKITSIYIPDGVETIKDTALQVSTWGISTPQGTLRIPSSVISLGSFFARGGGFEKVEYYSGVKIPKSAFLACLLLKTFVIYYEEGVVDLTLTPYSDGNYLTYHPFRNVKLEIIYVPDSLLAAYQNSENWKLGIDLTSKMRPLSEYTG